MAVRASKNLVSLNARVIFIKLYPTYLTGICCTFHQNVAELIYIPSVQEALPHIN